ncbi:MAG: hypothetical protein AAF636_11555 [Pseudomonadota bacterium]
MSLTKTEMIDHICDKVGQQEDEERAACGRFLQNRLRLVWSKALWLDSLAEISLELTPDTNELHSAGLVQLPGIYKRVLGTRLDDYALDGQPIGLRYRIDFDSFDRSGTPCQTSELGRGVWVYNSAVQLKLTGNDNEQDQGKQVFIRYIDEDGQRREETWNIVTSGSYTLVKKAFQVEALLKSETVNPVELKALYDGSTEKSVATLANADMRAAQPLWLRIGERPSKTKTLRCLGKVDTPDWRDDEEAPLRDAEDILLAYASGDMEQRHRQFGKAREYFGEGAGLMQILQNNEAVHTPDVQRIVPEVDGLQFDEYYYGGGGGFLSKS